MKNGTEAAHDFASFLNCLSNETEKQIFAKEFTCRTHRTLQQQGMDLFLNMCQQWAENYDNGLYDLRNEQTCKNAKKIVETLDINKMPLI